MDAVFLLLLGIPTLMLIRNNSVFITRSWFLWNTTLYSNLPSYEAMMFMPKYWHLWTTKQWINYIKE